MKVSEAVSAAIEAKGILIHYCIQGGMGEREDIVSILPKCSEDTLGGES